MRLLLAAGGTGGHVIPALVVARELRARSATHEVLFVGTARGAETRLVPAAGFPLESVEVGALQGQRAAVRVRNLLQLPRALWRARRILERFGPDVVLGVGGYAAGPVMLAAAWAGIPLAILEPNAVPGLANRWIAPYVARAFLAFSEAASYFGPARSLVTGIPVRKEFFAVPPKPHRPPFAVLIFGGSQGARTLNRAVVEALPQLAQSPQEWLLLHQTGESEYNAVREAYGKYAVPGEVFAFMENLWEAFARADLVVCRAGANTVAELAAAGRAAILVPFPAAANQHQLRNAQALETRGAARLILDSQLDGRTLLEGVRELLAEPARLQEMEAAMRGATYPEATAQIVEELERLAHPSGSFGEGSGGSLSSHDQEA